MTFTLVYSSRSDQCIVTTYIFIAFLLINVYTFQMGTTEVFVDIFSSMSQEIYNSDSESFDMDSNSQSSSSKVGSNYSL